MTFDSSIQRCFRWRHLENTNDLQMTVYTLAVRDSASLQISVPSVAWSVMVSPARIDTTSVVPAIWISKAASSSCSTVSVRRLKKLCGAFRLGVDDNSGRRRAVEKLARILKETHFGWKDYGYYSPDFRLFWINFGWKWWKLMFYNLPLSWLWEEKSKDRHAINFERWWSLW